jgi:hypothetical protein
MLTQAEIDRVYTEGYRAYLRDIGTHGPTLKPRPFYKTDNPYPQGKLRLAWQRGYNQDTRRVVADA